MDTAELGARLREVRDLRDLSLKAVAEPAEISPTYLQKLERGLVQSPSPRVLKRLSDVLRVPYSQLMELAGYVFPRGTGAPGSRGPNVVMRALANEALTADEAQALTQYLAWYRHQNAAARESGDRSQRL
jgi:transcriptional regulator with XRE-family HTH domain